MSDPAKPSTPDAAMQQGGCMCGGVRYEAQRPLRSVINCHCEPCRRITGHFMAATAVGADRFRLQAEATLTWYATTDTVSYGFCSRCGATLFWKATDKPNSVHIAAGTLDPPTALSTNSALYTSHASDYHQLDQTLSNHDLEK
jgi:hypothetical protein